MIVVLVLDAVAHRLQKGGITKKRKTDNQKKNEKEEEEEEERASNDSLIKLTELVRHDRRHVHNEC